MPLFYAVWGSRVLGAILILMSELHYFPRYSQKENCVTNNALLLLHRFYHFDRLRFQRLLTLLDPDSELSEPSVGLRFRQQVSRGGGVADGFLDQPSLRIAIETKTSDWFGRDQLERHRRGLGVADQRIMMLLSPVEGELKKVDLAALRIENSELGIDTINVTFERLIQACRAVLSSFNEEMLAIVDDFEGFCSAEGLLPSDAGLMLVPPCYHSRAENVEFKLYYAPKGRVARQPKYLGIYWHKVVRFVGEISTRVEPEFDETGAVIGPASLSQDERKRIANATELALRHGWNLTVGTEFFLCNQLFETHYEKASSGGIQGFQYHELTHILGEKALPGTDTIAQRLRLASWRGV